MFGRCSPRTTKSASAADTQVAGRALAQLTQMSNRTRRHGPSHRCAQALNQSLGRQAMAYDVLIEDAKICDGTGAPAYHGSVAVEGGKIAAVGDVAGSAKRKINGCDLVVAPGFIDPHTHYDAQICWD